MARVVARNLVAGFVVFGVACSSGLATPGGAMRRAVTWLSDFLQTYWEEEKDHVPT